MAYPIFANLDGRLCVIVGGGAVASRRAEGLAAAGARVRVVAPDASAWIHAQAQAGVLVWERTVYTPGALDGAFLVIAATDDPATNAAVCRDAEESCTLACCVDRPENGSFTTPASVVRGALTVAVSTGGASPTLASVLRGDLAGRFGPEWAHWMEMFARLRPQLQQVEGESAREVAVRCVLASPAVAARIASGDVTGALEEAQSCISSLPA